MTAALRLASDAAAPESRDRRSISTPPGCSISPTFSKLADMAGPSGRAGLSREIAYLVNLDIGKTVTATRSDGLLLLEADGRSIAAARTAAA